MHLFIPPLLPFYCTFRYFITHLLSPNHVVSSVSFCSYLIDIFFSSRLPLCSLIYPSIVHAALPFDDPYCFDLAALASLQTGLPFSLLRNPWIQCWRCWKCQKLPTQCVGFIKAVVTEHKPNPSSQLAEASRPDSRHRNWEDYREKQHQTEAAEIYISCWKFSFCFYLLHDNRHSSICFDW